MSNIILKTPSDYLNKVQQDLQKSLGIKDSKLLSTGSMSILANLLSNISFDAMKYYEYVTSEFNVATAKQFKSMLFHASMYSYNFDLAIPSKVAAYISIPKTNISDNRKDIYNIPSFSNFILNDAIFRIAGDIEITIDSNNITAIMSVGNNKFEIDTLEGTDSNNNQVYYIAIPADKVEQVERHVEKFVVPSYDENDVVSYNIEIPKDNQLYRMKTFVNYAQNPPLDTENFERIPLDSITDFYPEIDEFELKYFKFNVLPTDKVIFVNLNSYKNFTFTLGGQNLKGVRLHANDEVFTVIEYCKGFIGNVSPGTGKVKNVLFHEIDTNTNNTLLYNTQDLDIVTETAASGGADASSIDNIRFGILKRITERNSLITPLDFEKYFADFSTDKLACVFSRQIDTMSPIVTIYNVIRDPYTYEIIDTTTLNIDYDKYFGDKKYAINSVYNYNGQDLISPAVYVDYQSKITSYYKNDTTDISLTIIEIKSDPEIDPHLTVNWVDSEECFYFEVADLNRPYKLLIESNIGNYQLDSSNNFKQKIDSDKLIYNKFFKSKLYINSVKIADTSKNDYVIHYYSVENGISVMSKIQEHTQYTFKDSDSNENNKVLFVPFIDKQYFDNNSSDKKFVSSILSYFRLDTDDVKNKMAYNIYPNQCFMNTIDVDDVVAKGVVVNDNDKLLAKYPITIEIKFDATEAQAEGYSMFNLKTEIQLATIEYLASVEGDGITHYVTSLIKIIKNLYPKIIKDVFIDSPRSLVVNKWVETLNANDIAIDEQLDSVPTYFHFDINNIDLKFTVEG